MFLQKKLLSLLFAVYFLFSPLSFAEQIYNKNSIDIQAIETTQESKYPDYGKMFVGEDKHEKFNRKMFNINKKLNKYVALPVHILWSSIMPKFGMDRIKDVYENIEYPKRLVSCIVQRDGQGVKQETLRFLTNTTIGIGGLFDPADKIFKIKPTNENMEQALCKCKMKSGSYLVMPVVNSCTPRSLCGKALETALDPSVYLATPIASIIKFGLMLNKTSYMQPLAKLIETTYADPYDIHKKLFGIENYIRNSNLDRINLLPEGIIKTEETETDKKVIETSNISDIVPLGNNILKADIILEGYNSQTPVVDSMRTVLFDNPDIDKSMWNEISLWNRSFYRRIKTGSVNIFQDREPYKYKYILQKNKTAPVVILYPSIGEGAETRHSIVFAKLFYDEGYSVILQGSHFHWEFAKSMPEGYAPGIPLKDSEYIELVTSKILEDLSEKYNCEFSEKTVVGTSFGAMASMFLANRQRENNTLGINKYIAISPPIELKYAIEQLDKNGDEFDKSSSEVKNKTAITAAKILQMLDLKDDSKNFKPNSLPFSDEEGKLITTFILRQKLSDLIFTLENTKDKEKSGLYDMINNMSYKDYAEKYLGLNMNDDNSILDKTASLFSLNEYLTTENNYKIYQSLDDYFINKNQIAKLKTITGNHLTCLNCGAHLGFLYRKEFIEELKNELKKSQNPING